MSQLKLYIDTHSRDNHTFPPKISPEELAAFYENYQKACATEGVISLKIFNNLEAGNAFCLTLAPSAEAVKRAHERAGLPFDTITEVKTISPDNLYTGSVSPA